MVTGSRTTAVGPQLDQLPTADVIELLLQAEQRVVPIVRSAADGLVPAADLLARVICDGGRLVFAGAGTSGRIAAAEAAELPGTFGIAAQRCLALVAGVSSAADPIDDSVEDDAVAGADDAAAVDLRPGDVLVAVAASGRTPYTVAAARVALDRGAELVAVVTVASSPLASLATVAVEALVGDEVLHGSTRLTAGTAQKIALNTMTTAAMARAGHVHGRSMIDVVAANAKLRDRAAGIVAEIAGCTAADAALALSACGHNARAAVLQLCRGLDPDDAVALAAAHPSLRAALEAVTEA